MRIAVIGCGSIGRRHLRNLLAEGKHELSAYDPSDDAISYLTKVLKIEPCQSLEQLWERRPEAALICATPDVHVELALAAARQGAHLFIEKPLSHRLEGLSPLEAAIREKRLVTMVGSNMRFHPGPAAVKRFLLAGVIGAVVSARIQTGSYLPDWRPATDYRKSYTADPAKGGGALLDCIHEIDLALWYFGPASVAAAITVPAQRLQIPVEGLAEILLQHSSGVLSSVHLNFMQRDYRRSCQIVGEKGTIYWDFENPYVEVRSGTGLEKRQALPAEWQVNDMYVEEVRHFVSCIERGEPCEAPLEQGIAALRVALQARELASGAAAGSSA